MVELESATKAMHEATASEDLQNTVGISVYVKTLTTSLRAEAIRTLVNLLFYLFAELRINPIITRHIWLQFTGSANCSGYQLPTLQDSHEGTTVIYLRGTLKFRKDYLQECRSTVYEEVDVAPS